MVRYSIEPRTKKYFQKYGFFPFAEKYKKQLLVKGLGSLITASKKLLYRAREFLRNKIPDVVTNLYDDKIVKTSPAEEIIIPPEKKRKNIKRIKQVLSKWNTIKYLDY